MSIITELKWASMTAAINEIESPNRFLMKLLYGNHDPKDTEVLEIDTWVRARQMAPMVKKNSSAVPIDGPSQERAMVEAPNIRISRNIKPHELMFGRTPGSVIFQDGSKKANAIQEHMAKELRPLADDISNREEWMAAQTLTGAVSYSVDTGDAFTITYNRPAAHSVTLAGGDIWGTGTEEITTDFHNAKREMTKKGFNPTDAIMSASAADVFMQNSSVQTMLDKRNVSVGMMEFTSQFDDDGVIYLGSISGVRCWEYNRNVLDADGTTSVDMIRDKYVEFVDRRASAEFVMYYGAIPDMDALNGKSWVGERFSKSEVKFDPSSITALTHSRPLPVPRRPEATYSLKVLA